MAIPDFQTLMLPVLTEAAGGEARIGDVVERLADAFGLSPEDRSHLLPSGRQTTFANRVHWAKSYLGKAGMVELTRRAHFQITPRGREVLARPPERIDIKFLTRFPEFQSFRFSQEGSGEAAEAITQANGATADLTPDEIMRAAASGLSWKFPCGFVARAPCGGLLRGSRYDGLWSQASAP